MTRKIHLGFEFYEDSNSIGVYDIDGFLGSTISAETLWEMIARESKLGPSTNRLLLFGLSEEPKAQPDWSRIEDRFKQLDEEALLRRKLRKREVNILDLMSDEDVDDLLDNWV